MQWDEIGRGLVAMGAALLEVGVVVGTLGALTGFAGIIGAGEMCIRDSFYGNLYIFEGEEIMCKKLRKYIRRLIRGERETFKNKLCAVALLILGTITAIISNDWTFFVFTAFLAIPLLLAKENYIYG